MRKIFLILIIILLSSITLATSLNLELNEKQAEGQPFQGILKVNTDNEILETEKVSFYINGKQSYQTLENITLPGNINYVSEKFESVGSSTPSITYTFSKKESKVLAAIDLSNDGEFNLASIDNIRNLTFTIKGEQSGNYPRDVQIDIGADGTIDYSYKGELISNDFTELDKSYLLSNTPDSAATIKGETSDIFCQKIKFEPSKNFKVYIKAMKETNPTQTGTFKATITEDPTSTDCESQGCCEFTSLVSTDYQVSSCEIEEDISEECEKYVCLFVASGNLDKVDYKIGYEKDAEENFGYYNGAKQSRNYYIWVEKQNFNTALKTTENIILNPEILENYMSKSLLVPISISSSTSGKVILSNLKVPIEETAGSEIEQNSFQPISYTPKKLELLEEVSIPLNLFTEITVPYKQGTGNELYINFISEETATKDFEIIPGASIKIQGPSKMLFIGEKAIFSGQASVPKSGNNITSYSWDFGDETSTAGMTVSHSFAKTGDYQVTLKVTESDGSESTKTMSVSVANIQDSIKSLINQTKIEINAAKIKLTNFNQTLKEPLILLGIEKKLDEYLINMTAIAVNVDGILTNLTFTESQKETSLLEYNAKINLIRQDSPTDFKISSASFDSKAYSLEIIPSPTILQKEMIPSFSEKVLIAQQSVTINSKAYLVYLEYSDGNSEEFGLIKKEVIGGGDYFEILPSNLTKKEVLQPLDAKMASLNIIKFTSSPLVYTVETDSLDLPVKTTTMVIPANLASISAGGITEVTSTCGDDYCDLLTESEASCPEDCKSSGPWLIIILIVLIVGGAGTWYIFGYKGKYSIDNIQLGKKKLMPPAALFKSKRDRLIVKKYISNSMNKGFTELQINLALKKKGWNSEQIKAVLQEVEAEKKKLH